MESNRLACTCNRRMKSSQLRVDLADQHTSESAQARGNIIYSAWLSDGTHSVHKLPCVPRMYGSNSGGKFVGIGSKEYILPNVKGPPQVAAFGSSTRLLDW